MDGWPPSRFRVDPRFSRESDPESVLGFAGGRSHIVDRQDETVVRVVFALQSADDL
jgi:hypothetical protein